MKKLALIFALFGATMYGFTSCGGSEAEAEDGHEHHDDSSHHEGDGHNH